MADAASQYFADSLRVGIAERNTCADPHLAESADPSGISPFSVNLEALELPLAKNTSEITSQLTVASLSNQAGATFC